MEPPTKTVRIVDRSTWGTPGPYPLIRAVTVKWICPVCGGPRGEPQPYAFMEDGEALDCHRWWNPCEHVDYYDDVLREADDRQRTMDGGGTDGG